MNEESYFFPLDFNESLTEDDIENLKKYKKVYFHHETIRYFKNGHHISNYSAFNKSIDNLPDNIEKLFLGYAFNQKINKFPKNLKHLKIWSEFDHDLYLPEGLDKLDLGFQFNSKISLPSSLRYLRLEHSRVDLDNLPVNLKYLEVILDTDEIIRLDFLPPDLEYLTITGNFDTSNLPSKIKVLCTGDFNYDSDEYSD